MTMIPTSSTRTFVQIFTNYSAFEAGYKASALKNAITDANLEILYYLLYAKYGNNPITNFDENQFKYKLYGTIFMYGPAWQKRLDIQSQIRGLTADDLLQGAKAVHNHAFNPSTEPSTQSLEELTYINDQNTTNYKKSKMDAYGQLWSLVATDVTEDFLARFKPLFKKFVSPYTALYVGEE